MFPDTSQATYLGPPGRRAAPPAGGDRSKSLGIVSSLRRRLPRGTARRRAWGRRHVGLGGESLRPARDPASVRACVRTCHLSITWLRFDGLLTAWHV